MINNTVICYYETLDDTFTSDSERLVNLWRQSWEGNGWNPIVLSIDDAKSHPEWNRMQISSPDNPLYTNIPHEEHVERFKSKKALEYHMSCHNRLFAYCNFVSNNQTTLYADFDVINYRLTPEQIASIPDDTVIGYARCVVKLSKSGADDMINALKKQMTNPDPALRHDLEVCETNCTTFTNQFLPHCIRHQYEDCKKNADFVHYHGGWELLTEEQRLGCDTRWEFLNKFRPYKKITKQDFSKSLATLKDNKSYRVGDLFNQTGIRYEKDMQTILTTPKYQNTILYKYLTCKNNIKDSASMKHAIAEFSSQNNIKTPEENELVIHIRTGDIFEKIDAFDANKVDVTLEFYKDFFTKYQFPLEIIDKITVVTALHFGSNELTGKYFYKEETVMKNIDFLKTFEQQVNDQGFNLNIVSNTSTDHDMCYICGSKHYVPSLSPFSLLMTECMLRSDAVIYTQDRDYDYIRPELC